MTDSDDNLCAKKENRNDRQCRSFGKEMTLERRAGAGKVAGAIAFPAAIAANARTDASIPEDSGRSGAL